MKVYVVMSESREADSFPRFTLVAVYKTRKDARKRLAEKRKEILEYDCYQGVEYEIEYDEDDLFSIYVPFDCDSDSVWVSEQTVIE